MTAGAVSALIVLAVGWTIQRLALGGTDADARVRVESDVRASFDSMARALRDEAGRVADPASIRSAVGGDDDARRRLFDAVESAVSHDEDFDDALTVYGNDGRAVAWSGRPSELPRERLQGRAAWFLTEGTLGLRLMYLAPVLDGSSRVGSVVAERSLAVTGAPGTGPATGFRTSDTEEFRFSTRIAPVSIDLPFEAARTTPTAGDFDVSSPTGERLLSASVSPDDIAATRRRWQRATWSIALIVFAAAVLLLCGPLLDWRNTSRTAGRYVLATFSVAAVIVLGRILLRVASPADWSDASIVSGASYASTLLPPLLTSPFDFVATALAAGGLIALLLFLVERWRVHLACSRIAVISPLRIVLFLATQLAAGVLLAMVLLGHQALLRDTIAHTTLDLLHFSLHPWSSPRIALQVGLIIAHASAMGLVVAVLRAASVPWLVWRRRWVLRAGAIACWFGPLVAWQWVHDGGTDRQLPLVAGAVIAVALASGATRLKARYRHGSQAFRLTLLTLGLVLPAIAFYPTIFRLAWQAKVELVESRFAPQAVNQRQTVQMQLSESLEEIDRFPDLAQLITARAATDDATESTNDRAFAVWQTTALAAYPTTSSIELYGRDGRLVSRFAFNLPEDLTATPRSDERSCDWDLYEEVSPFFAEERRVLHAGRLLCVPGSSEPIGSIVVHVILDYENLPFIASRNPYVELLRPTDPIRAEGLSGRDVEYVVYGWSRTPLYSSRDTAWQLPDAVFSRVEQSRTPFWAELRRDSDGYDVYLQNDRFGIYALGFPVVSSLGHLVNLAELTVLAALTYVALVLASALFGWLSRRRTTAPALLREVRASFYRKLFLAFVLAVLLPVTALAFVTGRYVADQMRSNVEQEAVRTAEAAGRVVEDLVALRASQQSGVIDDNLMVWVSRLIDQDANVFTGARLIATSERNLFASGLLPTRTPADVYYALELQNQAATVTREHIGTFEYLMAAAPLKVRQTDAMLTVPLTSRQQEIEGQIDTLYRRVLLGALIFILVGAGIGYRMAERIADPVSRLTRATRRIARGDLDARIAATSSDEFRRLVNDFNKMAADLQRQRRELERTHRIEAWAEMARQVAHEIKNPLTPIQLNAEHLRRVHADRGEPLGPVVMECVNTILGQVKLLRQIASEFSSFASSPTAKPASVNVADMLREIVDPYRAGLQERIHFDVELPSTLPPVYVDRTLVARSFTNIVENALHAMPGTGTLTVVARADDHLVRVRIADTGVGMDPEALARAFEPYFSTKATGTGLGLPIAKRNVELSGGTITVLSERDKGTAVDVALPVVESEETT